MAQIKAVIDLGTNTFNLLIAEVHHQMFAIMHSSKQPVKLGQGGMESKCLTEEAIDRGLKCLKDFKSICEEHQVTDVRLLGTSALRNADNSDEFISLIKHSLDWNIEIINGELEFELIFKGVAASMNIIRPSLIMDIGGGSLELIYVEKNTLVKAASFECGVARMFEWQAQTNPLTNCEIAYFEERLESFFLDFIEPINKVDFIGSSGSFETFFELTTNTQIKNDFKLEQLSVDAVLDSCEYLIHSTYEERLRDHRIDKVRKLLAPLAAIQLRLILKNIKPEKFYISGYSLKEGALL